MDTLPDLHAPLLDWALWYATLGWPVFPCHGKEPVQKGGFHTATTEETRIRQWWSQWPACNIGAPMGIWGWALDEDPRAGGDATRHDLERTYARLPETLCSLSGRGDGGGHTFWLIPSAGIHHKADIGEGLDVIAQGGYVILPPSIHPDTGKPYLWEIGPDDILPQPAPDWLEALVAPRHRVRQNSPDAPGISPQYARFRSAVFTITTYDDYDAWLEIGMALHASEMVWARHLWDEWSAQSPKYDPEQQTIKWESFHSTGEVTPGTLFFHAKAAGWIDSLPPPPQLTVSTNGHTPPPGWGVPLGVPPPSIPVAHEPWRELLITKKNGDPTQNVANMALLLKWQPFWHQPENHLWWDSVRGMPMMGDAEIDDDTITTIAEWMGTIEKLPVSMLKTLERCVLKQCRTAKKDLLQAWLHALPQWDGKPRLETWLSHITGITDRPYARGISKMLILSMVARAMQPGCLYRYVVIFEGPEEAGKSTLVRAIARPEWYVELSIGLDSKESHMMLQGAWIAEMAELDSLSRTEETRLKAFITQRNDSYIPKFSNFRESTPRRCIFIGTTNEESYLKGQTGNTRYMPIYIGTHINVDMFEAMREQIFAEAFVCYQLDPTGWWRLPDDVLDAAIVEREQRRIANEYEQPLHDWLTMGRFAQDAYEANSRVNFTPNETSWPEIARWFLHIETPERWKDKSLQMQIAAALKALKWTTVQVWRNERNTKVWQYRPERQEEVPF